MECALVILSGGQDSTFCAALAAKTYGGGNVRAITFNYGQNHSREIEAAHNVARLLGMPHEIIEVPAILRSASPLTNGGRDLERYSSFEDMERIIGSRVEKTFVPMRNALFLVLAANRAVAYGIDTLITGVCEADNANYPDCREEFVQAMEHAINKSLTASDDAVLNVQTPLINASKADTVCGMYDMEMAHLWAFSHTSYANDYPPLDRNHATVLREQGFIDAGLPDPLILRAVDEGRMEMPETFNYTSALINSAQLAQINRCKERLAP